MADAAGTYRRELPRASRLGIKRYLGVAGAIVGLVGVLAVVGLVDPVWYYTKESFDALYLFAVAVAS